MTVYTPGGPCLTRLQHEQQVFQKQLQERYAPSPAKVLQNLAAGRVAEAPPVEKTAQLRAPDPERLLDVMV